jgi:DNA invertase Pin-like site-specific DNA recombinase
MPQAVGYTRVSSAEQGRSGLGLEAQRAAIEAFAKAEGFEVISWHSDVMTGKVDAGERPGLAAALKAAKSCKGPVLVSKLDRLSRDVAYIATLMSHRVEFIVTSLGRQTDPFVLHIWAALAQQERVLIARRTREALGALKARGVRLGMAARSRTAARRMAAKSRQVNADAALARAEALRPQIEFALKGGASLRAAAQTLNDRGVESPMGGRWHAPSLLKTARRLGLK